MSRPPLSVISRTVRLGDTVRAVLPPWTVHVYRLTVTNDEPVPVIARLLDPCPALLAAEHPSGLELDRGGWGGVLFHARAGTYLIKVFLDDKTRSCPYALTVTGR